MKTIFRETPIILIAIAFSSCAEKIPHSKMDNLKKALLPMEGVVVRTSPEPITQLEIYDAEALFQTALTADRDGLFEQAKQIYTLLIKEFPQSRFVLAARFNLGLIFEGLAQYEQAAPHYIEIVGESLPSNEVDRRTWLDAHFRLAVCESKMQDWWKAVTIFDFILSENWISDRERLEALVGRGIALQEAQDPSDAEVAFSKALRLFQEVSQTVRLDDQGLAAEAAFRMGEIARMRFELVELEFPQEILVKKLEEKCEELLSAQSRYFRAIRFGDAHTVAAAGLRIGFLYESLYNEIVALRDPPELNEEQVEIYQEEVRKRVAILVKKALIAYERSLDVGRRAPTAKEWVAKLEVAIERLKNIYLKEDVDMMLRND